MKKSIFYAIGIITIVLVACTSGLNIYKGNMIESLTKQEISLSKNYAELQAEITYAVNSTKKNHGLADFGTNELTKEIENNFTNKSDSDSLKKFFEYKYPTIDFEEAVESISIRKDSFSETYKNWVGEFQAYDKQSTPNILLQTALSEHQRQYLEVKSGKKTKNGEEAYKEMKTFAVNS